MTIRQWLNKNHKKHASNDALATACMAALGVTKTSFLNALSSFTRHVTKAKKATK